MSFFARLKMQYDQYCYFVNNKIGDFMQTYQRQPQISWAMHTSEKCCTNFPGTYPAADRMKHLKTRCLICLKQFFETRFTQNTAAKHIYTMLYKDLKVAINKGISSFSFIFSIFCLRLFSWLVNCNLMKLRLLSNVYMIAWTRMTLTCMKQKSSLSMIKIVVCSVSSI